MSNIQGIEGLFSSVNGDGTNLQGLTSNYQELTGNHLNNVGMGHHNHI